MEYNQVVAGYGFVQGVPTSDEGGSYNIFVPQELADHLQLKYGVSFLFKCESETSKSSSSGGPGRKAISRVYIRQRSSGTAEWGDRPGQSSFIATFRFHNKPGKLHEFLENLKEYVSFRSIKTFGNRGKLYSNLVFEGYCEEPEEKSFDPVRGPAPGFIRKPLMQNICERILKNDGTVNLVNVEELKFEGKLRGQVGTSIYMLDLPVVGGRFMKLTLTLTDGVALDTGEGAFALVRLIADYGSGTLELDTSLSKQEHYLIKLSCIGLQDATPVTECLLRTMSDYSAALNVDFIAGGEYFRPKPVRDSEHSGLAGLQVGQIQLLCTVDDSETSPLGGKVKLDPVGLERKIKENVAALGRAAKNHVKVMSLSSALESLADTSGMNIARGVSAQRLREKAELKYFRELLAGGRYAFLGFLGGGGFGEVNKYIDLMLGRIVAVKTFKKSGILRYDEVEAPGGDLGLAWIMDEFDTYRSGRKHGNLVEIYHVLFDGTDPVVVMQCLDHSLVDCVSNSEGRRTLINPSNIYEFVEMAVQLLAGLDALHENSYFHRDIKPSNIGFLDNEEESSRWKLMDLD